MATLLSGALVWYVFMPPMFAWGGKASSGNMVSLCVFAVMGYLFSDSQHRLQMAKRRVDDALSETRAANEKIRVLYEKTRELDTLKSHFFANVSHELRTPISLILGPVRKCLAGGGLDPDVRRSLETVERNARFIFRHVSDLLDIAKLEASRMEMRYSRTDSAALVRLIASFFDTTAADRNIAYRVDVPQSLQAELDGEKFQRIVLNLLSNAFKFTQDGGTVSVRLSRQGDDLALDVADNGPGIPDNLREAVFEPFRQADGQSTRAKGGTGLGLAIVKEFALLHKGAAVAQEAPGGGALFRVSIPLAAAGAVVEQDEAKPLCEDFSFQVLDELRLKKPPPDRADGRADGRTGDRPDGRPDGTAGGEAPLVLVVEDHPDLNAFLTDTLSGRMRVASAFNGAEGMEKALALKPDLILSDIMMPGVSGDEFLRRLKANPETADIPFVVLSAKADEALRLDMLRQGAQDYISKPFTTAEVTLKLESILAGRMRTLQDRARLAAIVEFSSDAIVGASLDGAISSWNSAARSMYGYPAQEALGKNIAMLIPEEAKQDEREAVERAVAGRSTVNLATVHARRDGRRVDVSVSISPIRNRSDQVVGVSRIIRDITEQKAAEQALQRALEERTVLLGEVHHRVKNNLQILLSLINLQTESPELNSSGDPLHDLRDRILAMALVHEHLYRSEDLGSMDIGQYLADLAAKIGSGYGDRAGLVRVEVDAPSLPSGVDLAIPLGLLASELITNAYKHAFPPGRPGVLRVGLHETPAGCLLTVEDDGPGLPAGLDVNAASSLGMELVHALVGQLHGSLAVLDGPGARFACTFPLGKPRSSVG